MSGPGTPSTRDIADAYEELRELLVAHAAEMDELADQALAKGHEAVVAAMSVDRLRASWARADRIDQLILNAADGIRANAERLGVLPGTPRAEWLTGRRDGDAA
ncbi:MAG: hypothetical protein AAGA90_21760 [Actinomycetota bacterium]